MKKIISSGLTLALTAALGACGAGGANTDSPTAGDENVPAGQTAIAEPGLPEPGGDSGDGVTQPTAEADDVGEEGQASVSAIDDDPEAFYGQTVTLTGDVVEVVDQQSFRIGDPEPLGGDDLLVLMPSQAAAASAVSDGQSVMVTGIVQQFDQTELESALGIDIDDALATELDGQPVIVAEQVGGSQG
jgi:hypothetical protein